MPRVRLKINGTAAEEGLVDISTEFPDTEFRILASQPMDDELLTLLEVTTPSGDTLIRHFEEAPEVISSEMIYLDEQMVLLQFMTEVTEPYEAFLASKTIPQSPTILRDGWFFITLTAPQERLSGYTDELAMAGIPYQIESVTRSRARIELLTDRQQEFIIEAVDRGYYDSPRGCTLTELAATFDVNKSAASGVLHRAEGWIIKEFVAGSVPETGGG